MELARTHALITAIENTPQKTVLLVVVVLLLLASAAHAGIGDSPIPTGFTKHVYSVAGVINATGIGSYFQCTNADTLSATVGVEIFGPAGGGPLNNAASTAISLAPGSTVIFGTSSAIGFSVDASLGPGVVSKGSARIVATSTKLICAAWACDNLNSPPMSSWQLTIVAKAKQKGD